MPAKRARATMSSPRNASCARFILFSLFGCRHRRAPWAAGRFLGEFRARVKHPCGVASEDGRRHGDEKLEHRDNWRKTGRVAWKTKAGGNTHEGSTGAELRGVRRVQSRSRTGGSEASRSTRLLESPSVLHPTRLGLSV